MNTRRFIEPLDVLFLRGNKLFGDAGSFGESLVPPWPSVMAGALRSRLLADEGIDLLAYARNEIDHPVLGTPANPGPFTVIDFALARRFADGRVERLTLPPADLIIKESSDKDQKIQIERLHPTMPAQGLESSFMLPRLPLLAEKERGKQARDYWLSEDGWGKYLAGGTPESDQLVKSKKLWAIDPRVGVGLDAEKRRAADGRLFTVQAVAMQKHEHNSAGYDVGFVVRVAGCTLPQDGLLRLGGDGRAAVIRTVVEAKEFKTYHTNICSVKRCRIVLTSPGLFAEGWRLPGADADNRFDLHGVRGRLVCAAVPRAETVSGWDLASHRPKPAQRTAPSGSVYWLDELDATPDALDKLVAAGLWCDSEDDASRRAEGFNRFVFAAY